MTIRDVQQQMGDNLKRWYPDLVEVEIADLCYQKVNQEHDEWDDAEGTPGEGEEAADVFISLAGRCAMIGIDLQAEIEKKLAIVSAREDQAERDRARGIG